MYGVLNENITLNARANKGNSDAIPGRREAGFKKEPTWKSAEKDFIAAYIIWGTLAKSARRWRARRKAWEGREKSVAPLFCKKEPSFSGVLQEARLVQAFCRFVRGAMTPACSLFLGAAASDFVFAYFRLKTRRTVSTACRVYSGLEASWKRFLRKEIGS